MATTGPSTLLRLWAPGGAPVRVEKSRIKVALLIACRYQLSRPIKESLDRFYVKLDVTRNNSYLDV
jgi:hypothetical protein